jgi:DNA-directed RNA polymerase specialized sigma24 family protein
MSRRADRTTTGGQDRGFQTTLWTEILHARSGDETQRRAALEVLLGSYWRPVYCYLRCKGYDREAAKDLTQGFFHEVVLGKSLFQQADRTKSRFRTFLLSCLNRYISNVHRAETTKQRMPEGGLISLEGTDWKSVPDPAYGRTPLQVFDYAWASSLLDQVVADVAGQCRETGNGPHWDVFRARVLLPILDNADAPPLSHLCEKHGIARKGDASKMVTRVKRLFRSVLRCHVRQFVESDAEVDDEIDHLMRILSKRSARL